MLEMARDMGANFEELLEIAGVDREEFEEAIASSILDRVIHHFGFENPITISIANGLESGVSVETLEKTLEFYEKFF